jgi:hypothetical protein
VDPENRRNNDSRSPVESGIPEDGRQLRLRSKLSLVAERFVPPASRLDRVAGVQLEEFKVPVRVPVVASGYRSRVAGLIEQPGHPRLVNRTPLMRFTRPTMATERRAVRVASLGRREPRCAVQALDVSVISSARSPLPLHQTAVAAGGACTSRPSPSPSSLRESHQCCPLPLR